MPSKAKVLGFFVLSLGGAPLLAHHPFSSEFDANKPVTLTGMVADVEWSKPHVSFYLDSKNNSGVNEQWKLEMASPDFLTERGIKRGTFKKGERLTVRAYRASNGARTASARVVTTAHGEDLQVADPQEDGGPAK